MTITISIIVPAYKVQNYIHACLQSILRQMESGVERDRGA